MAFTFPTTLVDLLTNLQTFLVAHAAELPMHTREKMMAAALHPSPVDRVVTTAEALYAVKAELGPDGQVMCAQLASFAALNGWHGMQERGPQITAALQRDAGVTAPPGIVWPMPADDPAPLTEMTASPAPVLP